MLNSHRSAFTLVAILAVVALAVGGVATYVVYRAHIDEEANRLREMAQSQARLMESVARFDVRYSNDFLGGAGSATIAQIRDAHANYRGFGRTGEFTLARLEGGQIVFILSHRHHDLDEPRPIPMNSRWAEPMRRALNRLSGTLIGLDYRGKTVLAAHEPVDILGLGIVAKIDMAEIREPFLRALGLACLVGTGLIAMGGFLFFRITDPLIKAINASEARFRGTFNQAAVGIAHVAPNGSWLEVNQKLCDIVGYTGDELLARTFQDITHPDDLDAGLKFMRQVLAGERETYSMEKRYFHKCGDIVWINVTVSLVRDEHRAPNYFISVIEDISDRKQAEDALREREQFISRALNASLTGIYIYNLEKGHNDYINSRYTSLTGYCLDDICIMTPEQFAGLFHPEDRERIFVHMEKVVQAEDDDVVEIEYRFRTRDGRWIWCLSWDSVFDRNEEGKVRRIIGTFLNITERKRTAELIEHQATFDTLTDLPNRRLLLDRLNQALARCRRHGHSGAVLFIDIDNFKNINDSLGHSMGDAILREVAKRLKENLREEDTSARLGGDEFVVVFSQLSDEAETAAKLAQLGAKKLQEALSIPYNIHNHELHLTPSIGIVMIPMEDVNADDVISHADTAMYRAKEAGRNAIRFFLPSMQLAAEERLKLQNDLRHALVHDEFDLHFQPKVDVFGNMIGAEALLRWQHPERGNVAPNSFIPLAEESGQILTIGEWVLKRTLDLLKAWTEDISESSFHNLAINVSPKQFRQAGFAMRIERLLAETGAKPEYLILELTEGVLVENLEDTIKKMEALNKLGIRFSIDDFGTGYSSLAYLKRLPLDELKIDRSFVRDVTTNPSDANLVATIITMAHHFGLDVIAEGVETEEQHNFLRDKGCGFFQGYYFSQPQPVEDFTELLRKPIRYPKGSAGIE